MTDIFEYSLRNLNHEGIRLIIEDAERRIGSHMADGEVDSYVEKQRHYIQLAYAELERRLNM